MVVVVDVHVRELVTALLEIADQLAYRSRLLLQVVCPPCAVRPRPVVVALQQPEQEEQSGVGPPEGMALEVQEHVTVVGCGQLLEPASPDGLVARCDHREGRGRIQIGAGL